MISAQEHVTMTTVGTIIGAVLGLTIGGAVIGFPAAIGSAVLGAIGGAFFGSYLYMTSQSENLESQPWLSATPPERRGSCGLDSAPRKLSGLPRGAAEGAALRL